MKKAIKMMSAMLLMLLFFRWMPLVVALCGPVLLTGCDDDDGPIVEEFVPEGNYRHEMVLSLEGFGEEKDALLKSCNVSNDQFIFLSTAKAWELEENEQADLKRVRDGVSKPDVKTLLQKIIPIEDLSTYMNNKYGGTIGGFVSEAADVKGLSTMYDVFWGMRLDYEGTYFKEDGAGYAVIRFYSDHVESMAIPYVEELGGTQEHAWPNGGGGFTTSTLGDGGYPEWRFNGYFVPQEGAELYEVTPQGREMLRSVYKEGRWQTYESDYYPQTRTASATVGPAYEGVWATYQGHRFMLRGEENSRYLLTTYEKLNLPGSFVVEKGVYGIWVEKEEVVLIEYSNLTPASPTPSTARPARTFPTK